MEKDVWTTVQHSKCDAWHSCPKEGAPRGDEVFATLSYMENAFISAQYNTQANPLSCLVPQTCLLTCSGFDAVAISSCLSQPCSFLLIPFAGSRWHGCVVLNDGWPTSQQTLGCGCVKPRLQTAQLCIALGDVQSSSHCLAALPWPGVEVMVVVVAPGVESWWLRCA